MELGIEPFKLQNRILHIFCDLEADSEACSSSGELKCLNTFMGLKKAIEVFAYLRLLESSVKIPKACLKLF